MRAAELFSVRELDRDFSADLEGSSQLVEIPQFQEMSNSPHRKRRPRTSTAQLEVLNETYIVETTPCASYRQKLANLIGLSSRSIQIWYDLLIRFQNRRQKLKSVEHRKLQLEYEKQKEHAMKILAEALDESCTPSNETLRELARKVHISAPALKLWFENEALKKDAPIPHIIIKPPRPPKPIPIEVNESTRIPAMKHQKLDQKLKSNMTQRDFLLQQLTPDFSLFESGNPVQLSNPLDTFITAPTRTFQVYPQQHINNNMQQRIQQPFYPKFSMETNPHCFVPTVQHELHEPWFDQYCNQHHQQNDLKRSNTPNQQEERLLESLFPSFKQNALNNDHS